MENKEEIVMRLKILLRATRAGEAVADLILHNQQDKVTILYRAGYTKEVDITADSGIAIIRDILKYV